MQFLVTLILLLFPIFSSAKELSSFFTETQSFEKAHMGIYVVDVSTGKEVYARNSQQFFTAASLQKIPLTVAAISILGDSYRFKTELSYEGSIDPSGILQGNLWITGGGDPTLSLDVFETWEKDLHKTGIVEVAGKIIVDASAFETTQASPYWQFQDLGNYYGAGATSLSINQNLYQVTFKPGKTEGSPAEVLEIDPPVPGLVIRNEVTTGPAKSGDQVCIYGSEYSPLQFYRGTVPIDKPTFIVKGSIPDPAYFCAQRLGSKIPTKGFAVIREKTQIKKIPISSIYSPPLSEMIEEMNKRSINIYAENILKILGSGKADSGAKKVEEFLKNLQIPSQIRDGSGLSRTNFLSPKGFTTLLQEIRKNPLYRSVYLSFPETGKSGSLVKFPIVPHANLRAKTGSMSNIYNLGGYLILDSGKEYAFCIFCNNYPGSAAELKKEAFSFLSELASQSAK